MLYSSDDPDTCKGSNVAVEDNGLMDNSKTTCVECIEKMVMAVQYHYADLQ